MTEVRTQHETGKPRDPRYTSGYRDGVQNVRTDLANVLRTLAVDGGFDFETLSPAMVRQIFMGVFGPPATDEEFGPETTGQFDKGKHARHRPEGA